MKRSPKMSVALAVAFLISILCAHSAFAEGLPSEITMAYTVNITTCEGESTSCGTTVMGFQDIQIPLKVEREGKAVGIFRTTPTQMKDATVEYEINAYVIVYGNGYTTKTLSLVQIVTSKNGRSERSIVGTTTFEIKIDGVVQFHGQGFKSIRRGQTVTTFATLEIAGR